MSVRRRCPRYGITRTERSRSRCRSSGGRVQFKPGVTVWDVVGGDAMQATMNQTESGRILPAQFT